MVVERYILNLTTIWQIDVVTYCIVGATFIGSPYVLMTRGHVNVDILPLHVRPARALLARAGDRLAGARLLHRHLRALHDPTGTRPTPKRWLSNTVWRARLWIPYLSMPIGLGLLVLQYVVELMLPRDRPRAALRHFATKAGRRRRGPRPGAGSLGRVP